MRRCISVVLPAATRPIKISFFTPARLRSGYGADGKLKKRFTITSVQRLDDGRWFFKQMKLEVRDPKDPSRNISINYMDMEDLKK